MEKIVIHVDDDSGNTKLTKLLLSEYEYTSINPEPNEAAKIVAQQVREALRDDEPAVVIMDHSLDRMDKLKGWDVIDVLLHEGLPSNVVIIVLSSEVRKISPGYQERGVRHMFDKGDGISPVKEFLAGHFA